MSASVKRPRLYLTASLIVILLNGLAVAGPQRKAGSQQSSVVAIDQSVGVLTAIGVHSADAGVTIDISSTKPVSPTTQTLGNPDRVVFDFPGVALQRKNQRIAINQGPVEDVRASDFSATPQVARVVVDLRQPVKYETRQSGNNFTVNISITPEQNPGGSQESSVVAAEESVGVLTAIAVHSADAGVTIDISSSKPVSPTTQTLGNPDRVVFDFPGVALQQKNQRIAINQGPVKDVRASDFSVTPQVARVVVDLQQPLKYETRQSGNNFTISISIPPNLMPTASAPLEMHAYNRLDKTMALAIGVQRIPQQRPRTTAAVQGVLRDGENRPVPGAQIALYNVETRLSRKITSVGDGVFRSRDLPPGKYTVNVEKDGFKSSGTEVSLNAGEIGIVDLRIDAVVGALVKAPASGIPGTPPVPPVEVQLASLYPGMRHSGFDVAELPAEELSPEVMFSPDPDRWHAEMPEYRRYAVPGEFPYVKSHWYDPFNRNKLKGDYPIIGQQIFFNFTGTSETFVDPRRLPTPSNVSAARPGSADFFGHGGQAFLSQLFLFSFDLSKGDTSFRPTDWRIRFTPAVNLNYLHTQEQGIVNVDVRAGTNRFDEHFGIQEAFFEKKLKDLSSNYDFVSLRVGIQQFNSDFRGFMFVEEQPGVRLFGNLRSNRFSYNLAYFMHLEKDTNSGLNSFVPRHQQTGIANLYIQDFIWKGYTTQFSFHYNQDNADYLFDRNGFLVRPAPVGAVTPHQVKAYYLGWTSNGHIHKINVSHAFYQAFGHDTLNTLSGKRSDINARLAALELSLDRNWIRFKTSVFYTTGDKNPRDGHARGFDTIVDDVNFTGGIFSLWNREGIRLTGTGVGLVQPSSLLPSLRSAKTEGQANFVNPGIFIIHGGTDLDLTPKLRGFLNVSYLTFDRVEPLQLLLFQPNIHRSIGTDASLGVVYRPPLTENITLTGGVSTLLTGQGFQDIYNKKALVSAFSLLKFTF